jgi:CheY-like chemotaxis protein
MGGLEFIEWMRRNGYHVPIILLSGDLPKGMGAQVERTNIHAILKKPCLFSELYLKVLEVFDES